MLRPLAVLCALGLAAAQPAWAVEVPAAVLRVDYPGLLPISRLDLPPEDLGFAGAALATEDNRTTGAFLGNTYEVHDVAVAPEGARAAFDRLVADGYRIIVVLAGRDDLLGMADAAP
jgi:hypothetical protein